MKTTIVLTMAEQKRVEVIQRVVRGELTMAEAAMVLGVTERPVLGSRPGSERRGFKESFMAIEAASANGSFLRRLSGVLWSQPGGSTGALTITT